MGMIWKKKPKPIPAPDCPRCGSGETFLTQVFPMISVENVADLMCSCCGKWSFVHREDDGSLVASSQIQDEWIIETDEYCSRCPHCEASEETSEMQPMKMGEE
jgi:hypothetical protein